MLSKENTRNRITLVSVLLTIIYLFSHQGNIWEYLYSNDIGLYVVPVISFLVVLLGFWWAIGKSFIGESFFTVLNYPAISSFIISLFLEFMLVDQTKVERITSTLYYGLIVFFSSYVLMLTSNILNVSYQKDIPLGQAARASSYVISVVVQFLGMFILLTSNVDIFLRYSLLFIMVVYYVYFLLWTLKIRHEDTVTSTFLISGVVFLFAFILGFWSLAPVLVALVLSVILYISLGVAMEQKERMPKFVWLEYGLLIIVILGIILVFSDWGINGPIL